MLSYRRLLALLFSLLALPAITYCQSPASDCSGLKPITTEELTARADKECKLSVAPSCERIPKENADIVFVGVVVRLETSEGRILLDGHCSHTSIQLVTLQVTENFGSALPKTVTVHAGDLNGYYFNRHETFLVFARKLSDETLTVSGCGGTKRVYVHYTGHPIEEDPSAKEDIDFLRMRAQLVPTGQLLGTVYVEPPDTVKSMPIAIGFGGLTLDLRGPVFDRIQTTSAGQFHRDNLPPGTYTVHLNSLEKIISTQDQVVQILPRACAKVNFYIESAEDYMNVMNRRKKASAKNP